MESDTNILIRQILATVLFILGMVWAIVAAVVLADVFIGTFSKIGPILFWIFGSLIWVSWGLIAFTSPKRQKELTAWLFSAFFHAAMLIILIQHIEGPRRLDRLVVIPIWWAVAFVASIAGAVLTLKNDEERV
jgi:hypothetical protein